MADVTPFAYAFEVGIGGTMTDIGRTLGSRSIGLIVQTVPLDAKRPSDWTEDRRKT